MADKLRVGLIGAGRIGQVHAHSVMSHPGTHLVSIASRYLEGAQSLAHEHGVSATDNPEELFDSAAIDALIIASPTATHVDFIEKAIDAGIPALCEKPIDLDIARVDAIREKVLASSTPIAIGFNQRFDPHFAQLHRRVEAGEIGALEQLVIVSRDPAPAPLDYLAVSGGILRDQTIHDFDMARFFVGNIVSVTAQGFNQFSEEIKGIGDYDAVTVTLRGENDESVTIINSRHCAYGYDQRLEAFGDQGMLRVDNVSDTLVRHFSSSGVEALEPYQSFFLERYMDSYRVELDEFVAKIRTGESTSPTFEDGRAALIVADAATQSAHTGATVAISP
ncbi:inositol 2-dehydrogenase [Pontimonas sp.]|nr:inositol 2-dehydrogenase [Pontimonas sp.]